jgi:hypothetical protein
MFDAIKLTLAAIFLAVTPTVVAAQTGGTQTAAQTSGQSIAQPAPAAERVALVSSADPRASAAGREMLDAGGSATDAALATMIMLTLVEPQSSGIGGGGFFVHHDAATNSLSTIDGRETAPRAARANRFLGADGRPRGMREVVPGGISVGVPGNIRLMAEALGPLALGPALCADNPDRRTGFQGQRISGRDIGRHHRTLGRFPADARTLLY